MAKYLGYALATFCFAVSVGCLVLWWRSTTHLEMVEVASRSTSVTVRLNRGYFILGTNTNRSGSERVSRASEKITPKMESLILNEVSRTGRRFGQIKIYRYFPLWYPTLVFALAGTGSLRIGHRFTIRSAIIATTVVAVLLGLVVAL